MCLHMCTTSFTTFCAIEAIFTTLLFFNSPLLPKGKLGVTGMTNYSLLGSKQPALLQPLLTSYMPSPEAHSSTACNSEVEVHSVHWVEQHHRIYNHISNPPFFSHHLHIALELTLSRHEPLTDLIPPQIKQRVPILVMIVYQASLAGPTTPFLAQHEGMPRG